jgi:hypothetical protein
VQLIGSNQESLAHAAVGVYADDLQILTAVAEAFLARKAAWIIHVGLHRAAVTRPHVRDIRPYFEHFDTQFMTGNARIVEERKLPEVAADIRAANANAMSCDERLAWTRPRWAWDIHMGHLMRR